MGVHNEIGMPAKFVALCLALILADAFAELPLKPINGHAQLRYADLVEFTTHQRVKGESIPDTHTPSSFPSVEERARRFLNVQYTSPWSEEEIREGNRRIERLEKELREQIAEVAAGCQRIKKATEVYQK